MGGGSFVFIHEAGPGGADLCPWATLPLSMLTWALDPVDGTVNLIHGSPLCAVSLGLITANRSVLGVIDLPFLDSRYSAAEGSGAHADGQPIRVSTTQRAADAVIALGDYAVGRSAPAKNRERFALTQRLAVSVQRVRMHGSAAIDLAWLAAGRVDAVVMPANKPWDTAAGVAIAREAGAEITDRDGTAHSFAATGYPQGAAQRMRPAVDRCAPPSMVCLISWRPSWRCDPPAGPERGPPTVPDGR